MTPAEEATVTRPEAQLSPGGRTGGVSMSDAPAGLLRWLRQGPVTIADLTLLLGVSRREVEALVEDARLRGEPIVGGNDGLRLTENPDELERYIDARRRRIASIYLGNRALRVTARRMREAQDDLAGLTLWPSFMEDAA